MQTLIASLVDQNTSDINPNDLEEKDLDKSCQDSWEVKFDQFKLLFCAAAHLAYLYHYLRTYDISELEPNAEAVNTADDSGEQFNFVSTSKLV